MTSIELPAELAIAMRGHAKEAYPEECCGFLLSATHSPGETGRRRVVAIEAAPNTSEGERRRRFVISSEELRAAEERAARAGREVTGFYHSHPDHPARPSEFDQDHAWPWYSYLVLSVRGDGAPGELGAFELDAERREFKDVTLAVLPPAGEEPKARPTYSVDSDFSGA